MSDWGNSLGVGATLRNRREEKGITLEEAQENTFILKRYLEAIEEEKWNELPGEAYTIGYLRVYSSFLGLDPEPIIASFKERERNEKKVHQNFQKKPKSGTINSRKIRTVRIFLFTCVIAAAALGITLILYNSTTISDQSTTIEAQQAGNNIASTESTETEEETLLEESPPPPEPQTLSITLLPEDLAWIEVESEGKTVFRGILIPGKKYLLRSSTPITVVGREGNRVKIIDQFGNQGYLSESAGEFARSFAP